MNKNIRRSPITDVDFGDNYAQFVCTRNVIRCVKVTNGKQYESYQFGIPKYFLDALIVDPTHTHLYEGKYFVKIHNWDTLEIIHAPQAQEYCPYQFQVTRNSSRHPFCIPKQFMNKFCWKYEELYHSSIDGNTPLIARTSLFIVNENGHLERQVYVNIEVEDTG